MAETHEFVAGVNGRCAATPDGDIMNQCGRAEGADLHTTTSSVSDAELAYATGPRSVPVGRRRSMPWRELPPMSKGVMLVVGGGAAVLFVCVVATLCRLILSAGGWLG